MIMISFVIFYLQRTVLFNRLNSQLMNLQIIQMLQQRSNGDLRCKLIAVIIITLILLILSVALVISLSLLSFTGVQSSIPLSTGTCTSQYYLTKYDNKYHTTLLTIFIPSSISIVWPIILLLLLFTPLVRSQQPTQLRLKTFFLMSNLQMITAIIPFSKILMFQIQFNVMKNCSIVFPQIIINILLAITSALICTSICQFIAILWIYTSINQEDDPKFIIYRECNNMTNITLQNQPNNRSMENNPQNFLTNKQHKNHMTSELRQREPVSFDQKVVKMEEQIYPGNRNQSILNVENVRQRQPSKHKQFNVLMRVERQRWRQLAKQKPQQFKMNRINGFQDSIMMSPIKQQQRIAVNGRQIKQQHSRYEDKPSFDGQSLNKSSVNKLLPSYIPKQHNFQQYIKRINSSNSFQQVKKQA